MIYLISSGCYSDYSVNALIEGPDGADLDAMQRAWAESLTDQQVFNTGVSSFIAYLAALPGWRECAWEECDTGAYGLNYITPRRELLLQRWGPQPFARGCPSISFSDQYHSYIRHLTDDGTALWRCRLCGGMREPDPQRPPTSGISSTFKNFRLT